MIHSFTGVLKKSKNPVKDESTGKRVDTFARICYWEGLVGDKDAGNLRKKGNHLLCKTSNEFITTNFYPEWVARFSENGFANIDFKLIEAEDSDQDHQIFLQIRCLQKYYNLYNIPSASRNTELTT